MPYLKSLTTVLTIAFLGACGGENAQANAPGAQASASAAADASGGGELTAVELEQGIGPIRDMELSAVDDALAEEGQKNFSVKCSACHKLDQRFVAPPLGDVLERRRPEFVMNMMLNASEMVARHPEIRELLAQYFTPMPVQVTEQDEARAILEYLRSAQIPSDQVSHQ